jgi:hypothetical protein
MFTIKQFGIFLLSWVLLSCKSQPKTIEHSASTLSANRSENRPNRDFCWQGSLNGNIPVFIHYQIDSEFLVGEIVYLNTKEKTPIKLAGTTMDLGYFRLLEFDKTGNITGIVTASQNKNVLEGNWFSPKSRKELSFNASTKDTTIASRPKAALHEIFGTYQYRYGEEGYQGEFIIRQLPDSKASFSINSVTEAPGRNVAEVNEDTITMSASQFVYQLRDARSCEIMVRFYKEFAFIKYTRGYCQGEFGNNATVDGIFFKTD